MQGEQQSDSPAAAQVVPGHCRSAPLVSPTSPLLSLSSTWRLSPSTLCCTRPAAPLMICTGALLAGSCVRLTSVEVRRMRVTGLLAVMKRPDGDLWVCRERPEEGSEWRIDRSR